MKRMFDKEEIVEIAKEEGGSITVDSELSSTSENPVQNKVIYEKTNMYFHLVQVKGHGHAIIINNSNVAFTKTSLAKYLKDNGYDGTEEKRYPLSGLTYNNVISGNSINFWNSESMYSSNGTSISVRMHTQLYTFTTDGSTVSITKGTEGTQTDTSTATVGDTVIPFLQ